MFGDLEKFKKPGTIQSRIQYNRQIYVINVAMQYVYGYYMFCYRCQSIHRYKMDCFRHEPKIT